MHPRTKLSNFTEAQNYTGPHKVKVAIFGTKKKKIMEWKGAEKYDLQCKETSAEVDSEIYQMINSYQVY